MQQYTPNIYIGGKREREKEKIKKTQWIYRTKLIFTNLIDLFNWFAGSCSICIYLAVIKMCVFRSLNAQKCQTELNMGINTIKIWIAILALAKYLFNSPIAHRQYTGMPKQIAHTIELILVCYNTRHTATMPSSYINLLSNEKKKQKEHTYTAVCIHISRLYYREYLGYLASTKPMINLIVALLLELIHIIRCVRFVIETWNIAICINFQFVIPVSIWIFNIFIIMVGACFIFYSIR